MTLSETFNSYSTHYFKIARDPYLIGASVAFAACALPFSTVVAAAAISAPVVYAGVGAACRASSYGLQLSGR